MKELLNYLYLCLYFQKKELDKSQYISKAISFDIIVIFKARLFLELLGIKLSIVFK